MLFYICGHQLRGLDLTLEANIQWFGCRTQPESDKKSTMLESVIANRDLVEF